MKAQEIKAVAHIADCALYAAKKFTLASSKGTIHGMITSYGEQGVDKEVLNDMFAKAVAAKTKIVFNDVLETIQTNMRWEKAE